MKFRKLTASAAAVIFSTAPALAANQVVSRAPTALDDANQMGGSALLLILAVLLIGLGVALAAGNKSDKPSSP